MLYSVSPLSSMSWVQTETQGSAEKSSIEKTLQINSTGNYIVRYNANSTGERKALINTEDAIVLEYEDDMKLPDNGTVVQKCTLRWSELRDILSRLMLIVGREEHEHAKSVNIFISTFQNIERLATAFVALYNSGCSLFSSWSAYIRTNTTEMNVPAIEVRVDEKLPLYTFTQNTNDELSSLCKALESIQGKWEEYVSEMRCKRPVINDFNMQQLSAMCSGLAALNGNSSSLDSTTQFYLATVNEQVTAADLVRILTEEEDTPEGESTDHENQFVASHTSNSTDQLGRMVHIDARSFVLKMVESLKRQFEQDEELAKAAVEGARIDNEIEEITQLDEGHAVNWIIENENDHEKVSQFAERFETFYSNLCREETTGAGYDSTGRRTHFSKFAQDMEHIFDLFLSDWKTNSLDGFVNLHQLANVLLKLKESNPSCMIERNIWPENFRAGIPNLVVCNRRSDVLLCILSLYSHVSKENLPCYRKVLLCSDRTSTEEVEIFLLRALLDPCQNMYVIAFSDDLTSACSEHLEKILFEKKLPSTNYKLVFFNSDDSSNVSVLLEKYKTNFPLENEADIKNYVCSNLEFNDQGSAIIDKYSSRIITSRQPSSGYLEAILLLLFTLFKIKSFFIVK